MLGCRMSAARLSKVVRVLLSCCWPLTSRKPVTPVRRWSGRETRALREALRMTVREFAARLGASDRAVSNWEAGGENVHPRPVWQATLDTLVHQAGEEERARFELLLTPPAEASPLVQRPVPLGATRRRSVLASGLAAAALPAIRLEDLHRFVVAVENARRYFDGSVVDYLRQ